MTLTVFFPFVGDAVGGSHVSALGLIRRLDPRRARPVVALHDPSGPLGPWLSAQDQRWIPLPGLPPLPRHGEGRAASLRYALGAAWRMRAALREAGADVVHTNDGRMHAYWSLPAKLAGAAHVWHHRGDPRARAANLVAPLVADRILTVSRFARPARPIRPLGRRLQVVPSPFEAPDAPPDRSAARAALLSELGLPPETRLIAYVGALNLRKRPIFFVEVLHALLSRHPDLPVHGLIFGAVEPGAEGLDQAALDRAQALGIADRLRLMGFRDRPQTWLPGLDALVVTALDEPFGRTLIEAMMLGTPVVATDHGGNPEALRHEETGFLLPPHSPEAFVRPLHALLTDPQTQARIAAHAARDALSRFSARAHAEAVQTVYEEIAGPPPLDPGLAAPGGSVLR